MRTKFTSWDIQEYLKTEEDIADYLNAAIEENNPEFLQVALGDIARARGMMELSRQTGLSREHLYRALSKDGNPRIKTVEKILDALGVEMVFRKKSPKGKSADSVM